MKTVHWWLDWANEGSHLASIITKIHTHEQLHFFAVSDFPNFVRSLFIKQFLKRNYRVLSLSKITWPIWALQTVDLMGTTVYGGNELSQYLWAIRSCLRGECSKEENLSEIVRSWVLDMASTKRIMQECPWEKIITNDCDLPIVIFLENPSSCRPVHLIAKVHEPTCIGIGMPAKMHSLRLRAPKLLS